MHSLLFNDKKDIDNRIGDNSKLYKQIDDVVRFGDPKDDLDNDFSEDFIKHVIDNDSKQECWSDGITYEEASETYVCKKIYCQQLDKEKFPELAKKFYEKEGEDQAHYMIIGEFVKIEK